MEECGGLYKPWYVESAEGKVWLGNVQGGVQ